MYIKIKYHLFSFENGNILFNAKATHHIANITDN